MSYSSTLLADIAANMLAIRTLWFDIKSFGLNYLNFLYVK